MLAVRVTEVENETRQRRRPEANAQHRSVTAAGGDACRAKGKSAFRLVSSDTAPAEIRLRNFDQDGRPVGLRDFRNGH
jgi:hypothetical protein